MYMIVSAWQRVFSDPVVGNNKGLAAPQSHRRLKRAGRVKCEYGGPASPKEATRRKNVPLAEGDLYGFMGGGPMGRGFTLLTRLWDLPSPIVGSPDLRQEILVSVTVEH